VGGYRCQEDIEWQTTWFGSPVGVALACDVLCFVPPFVPSASYHSPHTHILTRTHIPSHLP